MPILTERYELLDQLGAGPHGTVFLARCLQDDETCVVKVFSAVGLPEHGLNELETIAQNLRDRPCPGFLNVREVCSDEDPKTLAIALEFISAGSLATELQRRKLTRQRYTEENAWYLITQLILSLKAFYAAGFEAHGNLRLSNVMQVEGGKLKLTDGGCEALALTTNDFPEMPAEIAFQPDDRFKKSGDIWCVGFLAYGLCCNMNSALAGPSYDILASITNSFRVPVQPAPVITEPTPPPIERPSTSGVPRSTAAKMSAKRRPQQSARPLSSGKDADVTLSPGNDATLSAPPNKFGNPFVGSLSVDQIGLVSTTIGLEMGDFIRQTMQAEARATIDTLLQHPKISDMKARIETGTVAPPCSRCASRIEKHQKPIADEDGNTPLHHAALKQNAAEIKRQLEYVGLANKRGDTALLICVRNHYTEGVRILASREARKLSAENRSPLYYSLISGDLEIAALLDEFERPTDQTPFIDHGTTNLMRAVYERNIMGIWHWSSTQAQMCDEVGRTALIIAAGDGYFEAVRILAPKEAGMRIINGDQAGKLAIDVALDAGHVGIARFLTSFEGLKKQGPNFNGQTDLMQAAIRNDRLAVFCFLDELKKTEPDKGMTALMLAAQAGSLEVIPYLLEGEVRMLSQEGKTALIYAAEANQYSVVAALAPYEHSRDLNKYSALNCAIGLGFSDIADLLSAYEGVQCEVGVKFRSPRSRIVETPTALMRAAEQGQEKAVFCNMHQLGWQTVDGLTALMCACQARSRRCVELLLAEKDLQASDGKTAWLVAFDIGFQEVLDLIQPASRADSEGNTALHHAAMADDVANVRQHMRLAKKQNSMGLTALMIVAQTSSPTSKIDTALIDVEACIRSEKNQYAAKFALLAGNSTLAARLVKREHTLLAADGFTELMIAASLGKIEDVLTHLSQVRQQTTEGYTALMLAARAGHRDVCCLLSQETGIRDHEGKYAANHAIDGDNYDIACALAARELVVCERMYHLAPLLSALEEFPDTVDANTRLSFLKAMQYDDFRSSRDVKDLAEDDRTGDDNTISCLRRAAQSLTDRPLLTLQELSADLLRDAAGETALHASVRANNLPDVRKYLYRCGELSNEGYCAAELALDLGRRAIAIVLVPRERTVLLKQGFTELMLAAFFGDEAEVLRIIKNSRSQLGKISAHGHTAFMLAANQGHYDVVEHLEVERNLKDASGRPVHVIHTLDDGHFKVLSTRYSNNLEGLHAAVQDKNIDGVRVLIRYAGTRCNGWPALARAADVGFLEAVELLMTKEARMTVDSPFKCVSATLRGLCAIHIAALRNHPDIVRILIPLEGGSTERAIGFTALHIASYMGHAACVRELLETEAKQFEHSGSATALWYAAYCGHLECVQLLAPFEANLRRREGNTVGAYACAYACSIGNGERKDEVITAIRSAMTILPDDLGLPTASVKNLE
ncbi:Kinase, NEK [Giardia muris]|uniref:Kinase, NEK n=1 Tax=Giardia muris TaxID=5742 RepID=A0A4Z1T295_GIAMU|nr:Kinase, NEK [Giardia muris]|eukprot:TNJ29778.1 Kinase, NEK [Giardia muris]